jgi:hypothetical protein
MREAEEIGDDADADATLRASSSARVRECLRLPV